MSDPAGKRECIDCGKEIGDSEKFLVVGDKDGRKQFVHTLCFTNTTFDPERYQLVADPDSVD